MVTQLHADLVFLLLGLAVGLLIAVRMSTPHLDRRAAVLVGVILGQGTIGYVQYATDLPVAVVAAHLLGACLVWISALRLLLGIEGRRGTATSVPQAAAEPVAATPRRSPTSVG
jgi:cytochrome c oxidase assembly protein subunit 15